MLSLVNQIIMLLMYVRCTGGECKVEPHICFLHDCHPRAAGFATLRFRHVDDVYIVELLCFLSSCFCSLLNATCGFEDSRPRR